MNDLTKLFQKDDRIFANGKLLKNKLTEIEVYGLKDRLDNLSNHDKNEVALDVFKNLAEKIEASTTEYIGTKKFKDYLPVYSLEAVATSFR